MAFKTVLSVAAAALALIATAGGAAAVPARSAPSMAAVARQVVGGGVPQIVGGGGVPQGVVLVPSKNKRGDDKKVNVMIDVDIEKEEEKYDEYGYKKGDDEEVNVKIDVDVKKEKKEGMNGGVAVLPGLTGVGQPQLVPVATQQVPEQESQ